MPDPLDARALLALIPLLFPSDTSSPLPHPTDAVAALVHAIHTALGFRFLARGDRQTPTQDNTAGASTAEGSGSTDDDNDDTISETTTAVEAEEPGVDPGENALQRGWNDRGEDAYSFEYRHPQSAMSFRVRVGRMGSRIQIDGMAEDGAPHTISLVVNDVLNPDAFPVPSSATGGAAQNPNNDGDAQARAIGFRSLEAVRNVVDQYNRNVIARLVPGLSKEGYRAPPVSSAPGSSSRDERRPQPHQPPESGGPARPHPLADPLHPAAGPAGVNPASIGHRDLDPLSSLRPPGFGDRGGGMLVDFNHPLFDGRRNPDAEGPGGSIQPPGARWDPVGPGGALGPRFPSAGGNPLSGVGRGDREWGDEMPPPGEFGPDLGGGGGLGGPGFGRLGPRRGGGPPGFGGGFGGGFGSGGGLGGGGGGGFGGGGGMYM